MQIPKHTKLRDSVEYKLIPLLRYKNSFNIPDLCKLIMENDWEVKFNFYPSETISSITCINKKDRTDYWNFGFNEAKANEVKLELRKCKIKSL